MLRVISRSQEGYRLFDNLQIPLVHSFLCDAVTSAADVFASLLITHISHTE